MGKLARAIAIAVSALRGPAAPGRGAIAVAQYDSAGTGRRFRGWSTPAVGPNRAITPGLQNIRNRARDAGRNEWAARAARRRWGANLVGTGILAYPKTRDERLRQRLIDLWDDWAAECDADSVLDLNGLQTLIANNWVEAGEVFVRLRWRRLSDRLPAPLQLQVLEAEMVPLLDADSGPGLPRGHYIRSGIEFSAIGARVAYWMHRQHPGDGHASGSVSLHELARIPAEDVLHIYEPERPGQLRGVSEFATVLPKLRGVGNFDDAVLTRQEIANLFAMFITRPEPTGAKLDPLTGGAVQTDADGAPVAGLEPGISQELAPGEDVRFSQPPEAGTTYGDYMRNQHQHVAAGLDIPYELLTGDVRDVSDRTLRVVILEFRRRCQQRQWNIIIPQFCRKVRRAWVEACLIAGALTEAEASEARRVEWAPQGWDYLHPVQDVDAEIKKIRGGLKSRSAAILEKGDDPWAVEQQIADDNARADRLALVLDSDPRTIGKGVRMSSATQGDVAAAEDSEGEEGADT